MKGLSVSVQKVLGEYYDGKWDTALAGQASNLGASDDATGLPMATSRFTKFSQADYDAIYAKIKSGAVTPDANVEGCDTADFSANATAGSRVTVTYEQ
jgi:basic membrane protein A